MPTSSREFPGNTAFGLRAYVRDSQKYTGRLAGEINPNALLPRDFAYPQFRAEIPTGGSQKSDLEFCARATHMRNKQMAHGARSRPLGYGLVEIVRDAILQRLP